MRVRGFTLIETTVALAISMIAVAAGVVLLAGSQRAFKQGSDDRAIQETARTALEELRSTLSTAGYGLDPTFAFDTGLLTDTVMDRIPQGDTPRFGGYLPSGACNGTCRDHVDAPDELVFYSRDPDWNRPVVEVDAATPTITLSGAADLDSGQVLQLMCYGNSNQWIWAFVTVSSVDSSTEAQPKVTLRPNTGQAYDFPNQNALLGEPCFGAGPNFVRAFKVDRYRYYVAKVDDAGAVVSPWSWTATARPYLMLDQGLSRGGKAVVTAIAPDVEDLQVAYVFPMAAAGEQVLGATPKTKVDASDTDHSVGFDLRPNYGIPSYAFPTRDPVRTSYHPANIRAVRVAITVRAQRTDASGADAWDAAMPEVLNRQEIASEPGFRRLVFESTVYVPNLESRMSVFPIIDPNCATGNCGGG